ncbi:uncharacterized oxidoreductase YjmC-like [Coccinella septempunctata]|uniref:uncharacterized oxidoreductase YjmC-like n=1 Tax=Coccinella septempunctata TaxID=41139 RepID=UPI001D098CB3|nr:uncharacterized oxidoreductase YjmC-like [Coccinella septempunctata]
MEDDDGSETIKIPDLRKFVTECFCAIGVNKTYSEIMSDSLVNADLTGHHSHGVFRLDKFISDAHNGSVEVAGEPVITKETPASAWVDGKNSLGAVVGTFCMKVAIEKAKQVGAAIVTANNSNNFGVASFYSKMALKEGLLGFATTNSSPLMLPTRSKDPISGTNPISLAAPGLFGDYFLLDMATSVTSGGNIEIKCKDGEFLPVGWAVNAACLPETNADVALKSGRFLPLGSQEDLGSYKGSGLSIMVDILCGILSGAHYSHRVGVWVGRVSQQRANVGHCFIVIDPKRFAPNFEVRLTEFMSYMRDLSTDNQNEPVRIPGDRGREIEKKIQETGGITYAKYVIDMVKTMAANLKLKCVPFVPKKRKVQMTASEELAARLEAEKMSVREVSATTTEEDLTVPENSLVDRENVSFILDDSSDWMCPIAGFTYERDRATSVLKEKISRYSDVPIHESTEDTVTKDISEEEEEIVIGEKIDEGESVEISRDQVTIDTKEEENKTEEIEIRMEIDGEIHITGNRHD